MANNVCLRESALLQQLKYYPLIYRNLAKYQRELEDKGWNFYIVDSGRGYCNIARMEITIPLWVLSRQSGRIVQYILHEIAHALDFYRNGKMCGHKKPFMDILIEICPPELLVYEMSYKPKNLVAAGAKFCPDSLDF